MLAKQEKGGCKVTRRGYQVHLLSALSVGVIFTHRRDLEPPGGRQMECPVHPGNGGAADTFLQPTRVAYHSTPVGRAFLSCCLPGSGD